jgi:hypothetical protein
MIVTMAWRSLVAHPVRTTVLGIGFGLGVSVMATLLGVGAVVLEQARAPALMGGGDLILTGLTGPVTSARFVLSTIARMATAAEGTVRASPQRRAELFFVRHGAVVPVRARGGIPSLEKAVGDPETAGFADWRDTTADAAWSSPEPGQVLRAMDRFHAAPDVPTRSRSWAEWLYFKGRAEDVQFYVTFLVGPRRSDGRRAAGVRLQLDRGGRVTTYSGSDIVDERALLESAPDFTIAGNRVRLEGLRYHLTLDLPENGDHPIHRTGSRASGEIFIDATPGRSVAPIVIRGAGGWVSGYTVPVMSGSLSASLRVDGALLTLAGTGYHDHNWGFWEGVTWRWGAVEHEGFSFVYGRVYPPRDAADPERVPGFLVALGPDGPVGYTTRVSIEETDNPADGRPQRIRVEGRGGALDLKMDITVESAIVTSGGALASGPDFLQLRARYKVTGQAGGRSLDFTAPGAAETFRGR